MKQIKNVIKDIEEQLKYMIDSDERMAAASWGYEEGILISGNDAKLILKLLNQP